jgi:anti-anti-sigma factor
VLTDHGLFGSGTLTTVHLKDVGFAVRGTEGGGHRVVHVSGELDIAARDLARRACLEGIDLVVVVDMTDLTFIDCSGYGALMAARSILKDLGGSLTIRNQTGQPARLLSVVSVLQARQRSA